MDKEKRDQFRDLEEWIRAMLERTLGSEAHGFRIIITGGEIPLDSTGIPRRQAQGVQEVPVEMLDGGDEVLILAELPGAEADATHLQMTGSVLRIFAQGGDVRYHTTVKLPPVQPDTLIYSLKNGVLEVRLKKNISNPKTGE